MLVVISCDHTAIRTLEKPWDRGEPSRLGPTGGVQRECRMGNWQAPQPCDLHKTWGAWGMRDGGVTPLLLGVPPLLLG